MHEASHPIYSFENFTLDLRRGCLLHSSREVKLRNKSLEVLTYLVENRGRLVGKEELIGAVWPDAFVSDESVTQCLMEIRRALCDDSQRYVKTVPRRGYIFDAKVKELGNETVLEAGAIHVEGEKDQPGTLDRIYVEGADVVIEEENETSSGSKYAKGDRAPSSRSREDVSALAGEVGGTSRKEQRHNPPRSRNLLIIVSLAAVVSAALVALYLRPPLKPPKVLRYVQITKDGQQKLAPTLYTMPLLTDGSRLYVSEFREGRFILVQVSITGGETVPLMTPFRDVFPQDISPNRSELLVTAGSSLWVFPLLAGSPRRLVDRVFEDGAWSTDGRTIVYSLDGSDLYLAKSDGSEPRKLITVPSSAEWFRWSPDGNILRFTVYDPRTNSHSLWEVSSDGTNLHPLLPGWNKPSSEQGGIWTRDGKYFLFQSFRDGMTSIWAIREKADLFRKHNRDPVQLTAGPMSFFAPLPSIDGKKLFVVGVQARGELVRYDTRSGEFVRYLSGISAEHLDFSRDGEWITYVAYPEGTVWRRKVDGSERLQLTFPPMRAVMPRWSPDGKRIAFMGSRPGRPWKIYVMSAEGGSPQQSIPGDRGEEDPTWSADGTSLAFGRSRHEAEEALAVEILDLKSGRVSKLPESNGLSRPVWSPDGRYLAAERGGNLVLFDSTSQKWVNVANRCGVHKNWSKDGKRLYFDSPFGQSDPAIFCVRITDKKVERVANVGDLPRVFGTWYAWFGLTPDNSPLVLRSVGSQEIYALDWEAP